MPFYPHVRGFAWYQQRVPGIISIHHSGTGELLQSIKKHHPRFNNMSVDEIRSAEFTENDAMLVLAKEHGFDSWQQFKSHVEGIESGKIFEPFTLAFDAIQSGNIAALAALLKAHSHLSSAQGTNGSSLLNLSVSLKKPEMCRLLLDHGAEVDLPTTRGVTPLHQAAYSNKPDMIEMLIQAGASPRAFAYGDGGTPLAMALFWGHDQARSLLADYEVFPQNLRCSAGTGRLDLVDLCFNNGELTDNAKAHRSFYRPHTGFPVWTPTNDRQEILDEALVYAAKNGQQSVLPVLLDAGADLNGDPYRGTALVWAVVKKRVDVINWLLDKGADINHAGTFGGPTHGQGYTALHAAAEAGTLELVKLLLKRGADPNLRDKVYNAQPSGWAQHHNHPELVEYFKSSR